MMRNVSSERNKSGSGAAVPAPCRGKHCFTATPWCCGDTPGSTNTPQPLPVCNTYTGTNGSRPTLCDLPSELHQQTVGNREVEATERMLASLQQQERRHKDVDINSISLWERNHDSVHLRVTGSCNL